MADRQDVTRKLAAILYADVAGYSRLTGADEEGTHKIVADYLDAISEMVSRSGGRVVHYAGDAVLADFPSVVTAVKSAIEIQKELGERNAGIPDDRKIQFRIGVNLGDVIVDRDDIYGNGVNVAARLESLADPGGICVSGSVLEQVQDKVDVGFEDMGPQEVKNIAKPVQVYRVVLETPLTAILRSPLPDKPSIAVLPFDNLGGDPAQDFLGDGIAEDIITELSRFHSLFVISRASSFSFKGQLLDARRIAKKLGVRYILEGSVRTHGSRIRITAQLIEAEHDLHLWSERYDRETDDIFALQDEITRNIVGIIEPAIGHHERERARIRDPIRLDAWALFQRGLSQYYESTRESLEQAVRHFEEAINFDEGLAAAHALRADSLVRIYWHDGPEGQMPILNSARSSAERGIILDPQDARCPLALARVHLFLGNGDEANKSVNKSLELNSNLAMAYYARGWIQSAYSPSELVYRDCLRDIDYSIRLSPNDPFLAGFMGFRARILLQNQRFEEAVDNARIACQCPNTRPLAFAILAAALKQLQRYDESKTALAELKRRAPQFNLGLIRSFAKTWTLDRREFMEELFRAAGVPE